MIDPHFVILGAALSLIGSLWYAALTVRGLVRPNRVSWFLWGAAPLIGFFAQLDQGVGLPAMSTLAIGVGPLTIFAASFLNRESYWRVTRFDLSCGIIAVLALIVWTTLDNALLAVLVALAADAIGGIPTILKVWRHPESERSVPFLFGAANGAITLFSLQEWNLVAYAFPLYLTVLGVSLAITLQLRGRRPAPTPLLQGSASCGAP